MHGTLSGSRSIYHPISRVSLLSLQGEEDTAPKYRLLRQLILQLRSKPPCVAIINSKARTLDIRFSAALGRPSNPGIVKSTNARAAARIIATSGAFSHNTCFLDLFSILTFTVLPPCISSDRIVSRPRILLKHSLLLYTFLYHRRRQKRRIHIFKARLFIFESFSHKLLMVCHSCRSSGLQIHIRTFHTIRYGSLRYILWESRFLWRFVLFHQTAFQHSDALYVRETYKQTPSMV